MRLAQVLFGVIAAVLVSGIGIASASTERTVSFDDDWRFNLGDVAGADKPDFPDSNWRSLDLPHDWMIEGPPGSDPGKMEGPFDPKSPGGAGNGYLNGGVGWYRKTFSLPAEAKGRHIAVQFDGIYMNSEVWINGASLGKHPYGYTSFEYDLTPYLKFGDDKNVLAVRAEVVQPCSRFYSGAGIYRHVWLTNTALVHVAHWGAYVTTLVKGDSATVTVRTVAVNDSTAPAAFSLTTDLLDPDGHSIGDVTEKETTLEAGKSKEITQTLEVDNPQFWSIESPILYKIRSSVSIHNKTADEQFTRFGIRSIEFTIDKGFFLNGKHVQIQGVCDHHDLGCLGAAVNHRAIQRQLEILKSFGVNAIRTSHYPPAPELLDLADEMGFVVMDEAFDEWKHNKTKFGYGQFFDANSESDIVSMVRRDRNHPSVVLWSIGNEIREQDEKNANQMSTRLADFVKREDPTRPTVSAMSNPGAAVKTGFSKPLDVFGANYSLKFYTDPRVHGIMPMIGSETTSALSSRGEFGLQADDDGNVLSQKKFNHQCTDYDIYATGWGSTGHAGIELMKKDPWMTGEFVWTGFDYLGEPTPYTWPSRSSYFGIVDLCGFPKERYYLYQSQWTDKPMVHLLPHWNWEQFTGKDIPVWCFTNADSVELFLNDKSLGQKTWADDRKDLHLEWSVPYTPGLLKAVAKKGGKVVAIDQVRTAGKPAKILLSADHPKIAVNRDMSFITATVTDAEGNVCPDAQDQVRFAIDGPGTIAGLDNGDATNHESFQGLRHKVFHGLGLVVIQSTKQSGAIHLNASAEGLEPGKTVIDVEP